MDSHPIPDRAQPETDPQPAMAGRIPGSISDRRRGNVPTASCRATRSRRAGEAGRSDPKGRGRTEKSRGGSESRDARKRQGNQGPRSIDSDINYRKLYRRRRTSWTRSQSQRVNRWSSWQRNRARVAGKRQGLDMRDLEFPPTNAMNNVFDTQRSWL
jgi:hypothetical protein